MYDLDYDNLEDDDILNWNRNITNNTNLTDCTEWIYDQSEFISTINSKVGIHTSLYFIVVFKLAALSSVYTQHNTSVLLRLLQNLNPWHSVEYPNQMFKVCASKNNKWYFVTFI